MIALDNDWPETIYDRDGGGVLWLTMPDGKKVRLGSRKGGPGSGWFAPPKGTHGPGSQGGKFPDFTHLGGDYRESEFPSAQRASYFLGLDLPGGWEGATDLERSEVKDDLIRAISERSGVDYLVVDEMIAQWSDSSFGDRIRALAMQRDVCAEFGLLEPRSLTEAIEEAEDKVAITRQNIEEPLRFSDLLYESWKPYHEAWLDSGLGLTEYLKRERPWLFPIADSATQRKVLRAMYDITQERLKAAGFDPDGYITLFRGVSARAVEDHLGWGPVRDWDIGDTGSYAGNPMESWTVSMDIAKEFALSHRSRDYDGVAIAMDIPISSIIATSLTGFGCLTEGEFVVMGAGGDCLVITSYGRYKGGPGSGWFAPPKGTHKLGSQGGKPEYGGGLPFDTASLDRPSKSATEAEYGDSEWDIYHDAIGYLADAGSRQINNFVRDDARKSYLDAQGRQPRGFEDLAPSAKHVAVTSILAELEKAGVSTQYEIINKILATWADAAADDVPESVALQVAAAREFGLGIRDSLQKSFEDVVMDPEDVDKIGGWGIARGALRSIYQITQQRLAQAGYGPDDLITVFRGTGRDPENPGFPLSLGAECSITGNPLQSWSFQPSTAQSFASGWTRQGGVGIVFGMRVPRRAILSIPTTGPGCLSESEAVIMVGSDSTHIGAVVDIFMPDPNWLENLENSGFDYF